MKPSIADKLKKKQEALDSMFKNDEQILIEPKKIPPTDPDPATIPEPSPGTPPPPEPQPQTEPDKQPTPDMDTLPEKELNTDKETGTGTGTFTDPQTEPYELLKPSDTYIRKVYYPLTQQDDYIKKKAKKYKKTESEILRFLLEYAIKNVKI